MRKATTRHLSKEEQTVLFGMLLEHAMTEAHAAWCHARGARFKYTPLEANWFVLDERQTRMKGKLLFGPEFGVAMKAHSNTLNALGVEALSELISLYPLRSERKTARFD